ncbi:MAG: hypothetical protein F6K23_21655 [Okeania sp. SIO2C9]|uniref:hypothetical protein n=1 Tax=Okeania sp. SIO2C9 TaxID=2607791 RepID=UPI0013C06AAF|nr:hypothetical protein [Okeania sp. SIO2C9]NEQ75424.1 hypothetical protein [Okeania sp. SIO2C9]
MDKEGGECGDCGDCGEMGRWGHTPNQSQEWNIEKDLVIVEDGTFCTRGDRSIISRPSPNFPTMTRESQKLPRSKTTGVGKKEIGRW